MDKIFLRENSNSSAIAAQLQPYVDAGAIDFGLLDGPKHPTQTNWYNDCAAMARAAFSWVAFIDLDEYMVVLDKCGPSGHLALAARARHGRSGSPRLRGRFGAWTDIVPLFVA